MNQSIENHSTTEDRFLQPQQINTVYVLGVFVKSFLIKYKQQNSNSLVSLGPNKGARWFPSQNQKWQVLK